MTSPSADSTEEPLAQARRWLARARKDFEGYQRLVGRPFLRQRKPFPPDPALAIYLLEQANEKAMKAVAIASGQYTHQDFVKEFGHNSVGLWADFMLKLLGSTTWGSVILDSWNYSVRSVPESHRMSEDEAARQLKKLSRDKTAPRQTEKEHTNLYEEFRSWPAENTGRFVESLFNSYENMSSILEQLSIRRGSPGRAPEIGDTEARSAWACGALLFLCALTFPHEASTRYPAPRSSVRNDHPPISELDCESYSNPELAVVKHLRSIGELTQLVLDHLDFQLQATASFNGWSSGTGALDP